MQFKKMVSQSTFCFATVVLFVSTPVNADFMNGEMLLDSCRPPIGSDCYPYLAGTFDGLTTAQYSILTRLEIFHQLKNSATEARDRLSTTDSFACPPPISGDDLRRIVLGWLSRNPDTLEIGGGIIVQAALAEAYPCHN